MTASLFGILYIMWPFISIVYGLWSMDVVGVEENEDVSQDISANDANLMDQLVQNLQVLLFGGVFLLR